MKTHSRFIGLYVTLDLTLVTYPSQQEKTWMTGNY